MKKQNNKSAFFSLRFLTGFALCSIGVFLALIVFARPNKPVEHQDQSLAQQSIPTFAGVALAAQKHSAARPGTIRQGEGDHLLDLAELDIHPATAPLPLRALSGDAGSPEGAAMGTGKAFLGITHEVVNQVTTGAFGTLSSGWIPAESVQFYLNGVLAGTFAASADGTVAVGINTGTGFGYITIEEIGLTSGRDTGGVVQVAPTGPYLPGVTGAPHAINTTASAHFYLYGWGYPPNIASGIPLYRNGVFLANVSTNASGRFFVTYTPANSGDTSAIYSADTVSSPPGGVMAGVSLEERADAGTPPVGDQNAARIFWDRATLNSGTGGVVALVGEGFEPGETVTISGCAAGSLGPAGPEGQAGTFLTYSAGAGVSQCVLTGGTSGRGARGTGPLGPGGTNPRGPISLSPLLSRAPRDTVPIPQPNSPPP